MYHVVYVFHINYMLYSSEATRKLFDEQATLPTST